MRSGVWEVGCGRWGESAPGVGAEVWEVECESCGVANHLHIARACMLLIELTFRGPSADIAGKFPLISFRGPSAASGFASAGPTNFRPIINVNVGFSFAAHLRVARKHVHTHTHTHPHTHTHTHTHTHHTK